MLTIAIKMPRHLVSQQIFFAQERPFVLDMLTSLKKCAGNLWWDWVILHMHKATSGSTISCHFLHLFNEGVLTCPFVDLLPSIFWACLSRPFSSSHLHWCLVETQERAFSVATTRPWNSLPQEASLTPALLSLRKQAKSFHFRQAYS